MANPAVLKQANKQKQKKGQNLKIYLFQEYDGQIF